MAEATQKLRLKLVRSPIGATERQRATVRALGLRRLHQVVEQADSAVTRGMVQKVAHLVHVVEAS
ncbi:MAG: 50S ribosomal protein L30 [Chloroflexi bacterium]|nr:50S ribosomal protein L30 [Chloroflexota bacterium]MBV9896146.1 50S ribosomal protein L30 [Chloroflexota bacterium]